MTATKDDFFNPTKLSSRDKAAATDHTARAIIDAEALARVKKTEKLKNLRLQQEAVETPKVETPRKKRTTAAGSAS
jgi:hypothetical protein